MRRKLRLATVATVATGVAMGSLLAAPVTQAADNTIVMWVDEKRAETYRELFANGYRGYTINVVL